MKKPTYRKRIFAWGMTGVDEINHKIYGKYKKDLFKNLSGMVVEIGPGSGVNFEYFQNEIAWAGVEPNEAFHQTLKQRAEEKGLEPRIIKESASRIFMDDNVADYVLSTLVLCSVEDPARAIAEMKRILKPGGKLIFIEHVAALKKTRLRIAQNVLNPLNRFMADGCNCNRETWFYLANAGFKQLSLNHVNIKGSLPIHAPHIMGYAIK